MPISLSVYSAIGEISWHWFSENVRFQQWEHPLPQVPLINYIFGCFVWFFFFFFFFGSRKPPCDAFLFSWVLFSFLNSEFPFSPSKSSISLNGLPILPFHFAFQLLDCLEAKETGYIHAKLGLTLFPGFKVSPEPTAFWLFSAHSATGLTPYLHSAFSAPSRRTVVLEKTLESPLDFKEIKWINPKGNQVLNIHRKDWCWSWNSNTLATSCEELTHCKKKNPDAGENWGQEEKGTMEDEMVGWYHRLNGHEFEQAPGGGDRHGSVACCSPWGRKESGMIWTDWRGKRLQENSFIEVGAKEIL